MCPDCILRRSTSADKRSRSCCAWTRRRVISTFPSAVFRLRTSLRSRTSSTSPRRPTGNHTTRLSPHGRACALAQLSSWLPAGGSSGTHRTLGLKGSVVRPALRGGTDSDDVRGNRGWCAVQLARTHAGARSCVLTRARTRRKYGCARACVRTSAYAGGRSCNSHSQAHVPDSAM